MSDPRKLLMIPGPVEVSPAVRAAHDGPPPGHLAPALIEAYGQSLERSRRVWQAPAEAQPFIVAGSGTLAMDMAAANLVDIGDRALVLGTGYFSDRMAEILRRHGADVAQVDAEPGQSVSMAAYERALEEERPKAVFATHVDTSTGVRMDPAEVARRAHAAGAMTVIDGVCATAAEALSMSESPVDIYLTGSQKALGLPAGLAFLVASPRAMEARARRTTPPALYLDFESWLPIMRAYERREKAYFATPATNLVAASAVALGEILDDEVRGETGVKARFLRHAGVAKAMQAAWQSLGLEHLASREEDRGVTLSALRYPAGVGPELVQHISEQGVVVAGGLHPELKSSYFRVGHMGWVTTQPELLERCVDAVGKGLAACGRAVDVPGAKAELRRALSEQLGA